ncbi:hypothetical protein L484_002496 [Morus notabilis]|uniref:Uncharacterized protein n=1 Tax=Morus notabilis TaxID=981085 RepID=W9RYQ7_9ROSA|nr:hypothetical protein L484_002496 [Morus notabilis]
MEDVKNGEQLPPESSSLSNHDDHSSNETTENPVLNGKLENNDNQASSSTTTEQSQASDSPSIGQSQPVLSDAPALTSPKVINETETQSKGVVVEGSENQPLQDTSNALASRRTGKENDTDNHSNATAPSPSFSEATNSKKMT